MQIRRTIIDGNGVPISGALYLPDQDSTPALCICHGIPSGEPGDPADGGYPALAERFCKAGLATMVFAFRGTGESGGSFDMLGWVDDLYAALDYLWACPEIDPDRLYLMGFSGGAAVSTYVAAHDPRFKGVILCACPVEFALTENPDQWEPAVEHFRHIGIIKAAAESFDTGSWVRGFAEIAPIKWVDRISPRPVLFLHGSEDELIDVSQVERLFTRAEQPKDLVIIPGAGHKLRLSDEAMESALIWLRQVAMSD